MWNLRFIGRAIGRSYAVVFSVIFLAVLGMPVDNAQGQMSQVVHDTRTEFQGGTFNQTLLEGTEAAPEITLDSYSVFSWTFQDEDISGWSTATKDLAIAEENPPGQIHLRAQRSAQNESYALFTRGITVPVKFVVEYRIYFDNLMPSGVSVPGDVLGVDQPTGACARLDLWNPVASLRMDIFTDRMVSFWTRSSAIKDYPTVSYFDVTTAAGQWYTLRFEGDFTDPQLPVQVYRDNTWIGELKGDTHETGNSIRPMAYSREGGQVAEVHIDYVKLGTSTSQHYATGTYTSPALDLGATSFGPFSWTDKAMGYPYPWGEWTKYEGNPVVEESPNGNLVENILTDIYDPLQQPILYPHPDTGVNYYWLVNATCCGGDIRISYSLDLLEWTPYEHNPILSPRAGEGYLFSPNIFKKGDLYYLVHDVSIDGKQRIAYATAPTPLGPWTGGWTTGQRILDIGALGTWEYGRVTEPFVFKDGDTYYLFYMGDIPSSGNGEQIGLATTTADDFPLGPGGGLWTKHGLILPHNPDPTAWDRGLTADPSVIKVGDIFYMLYTGSYANEHWQLGIAWADSPYGPWNRPSSPNVLRGPPGAWDSNQLVRGAIHFHEGRYYMPYTGNYGKYRGGMATADPFLPETLISFNTRTSSDGSSWEEWAPVSNGAVISSTAGRYLQYQATLDLGSGGSSPGLTSVTINYNTNTAPVANDCSATTDEDTPQTITLSGTDANGNDLTFSVVSGPGHGSLGIIGAPSCITSEGISTCTATVTYTPTGNYNGPDSFTFTVNDGTEDSGEATVTITVGAVNDTPVANDQAVSTAEDIAVSITLAALDVEGDSLTYIVVTPPAHGSLSGSAPNLTYTPSPNYSGPDSFTFKSNDAAAESNLATVSITVTPVNDAPATVADAYSTNEDTLLSISASGVLGNDADIDGDSLTAVLVSGPSHGTLTLNANGSFTYNPTANYNGADSFTYKANDGSADSNVATVSITVNPINDAPVAAVDSYSTNEDVQLTIASAGVLGNDTDVEGTPLSAVLVDGPAHALTFSLNSNGSFTYTPAANFNGPDSFTYKANDGTADSNTVTVTLTVNAVNDAPTVTVSPATQTVQYSDNIPTITITAKDIDSSSLTATVTSPETGLPPNLTLTPSNPPCTTNQSNGETTCTWTIEGIADVPAGDYSVTITVTDDDGESGSGDITISVTPEDALVAFDDDNPVAVQVTAPGGTSGEIILIVDVKEIQPDLPQGLGAYGDINLAQISMVLQPVGPGSVVPGSCTPPDSEVDTGYDAAVPVTCTFNGVPVNTYTVQVTINGGYYTGSGEDVLVVYDPSLGFATGGGWFYWPDTENTAYEGYPGDRTNFGFTMKYNKKGTNIQGSLLLIRHLPDGTTLDSTICGDDFVYNTIYRVKSNALYGLALGQSTTVPLGWASFSGKSTYMDPCMATPEGNYQFTVYVEDGNEPGQGVDMFWIELKDQNREAIAEMSMSRDSEGVVPIEIQGGNIVVPHREVIPHHSR